MRMRAFNVRVRSMRTQHVPEGQQERSPALEDVSVPPETLESPDSLNRSVLQAMVPNLSGTNPPLRTRCVLSDFRSLQS